MAYVAFASAKASPGVTTTVAALVSTWPRDRDLVVAELDPAGGDLGVRFDLATEPGLVTLAAAGRRQLDRSTLVGHTQPLPFADRAGADGDAQGAVRRVLVGPVAADQAGAALAALRGVLPGVLSSLGTDVLVDCGRLDPGSAAHDVITEADLVVVVARPVVAEVHHLAARLSGLRPKALSLLLIGDRPYSVAEVADAVGANPLGTLPVDDRAAAALTVGRSDGARILRRSRLLARRQGGGGGAHQLAAAAAAPSPGGGARGACAGDRPRGPTGAAAPSASGHAARGRRTRHGPSTSAGSATRNAGEPRAQGAGAGVPPRGGRRADRAPARRRAGRAGADVAGRPAAVRAATHQPAPRALRQATAGAGPGAADVRGRDGAGAGDPRRPVRARRAATLARRRVHREHRRQRLRRRVGHPRRRHQGPGPAHRRQRRRADRHPAHDRRPGRPDRATLRHRVTVAQPAAPRRQPTVRRHGGHVQALRGHPAPPLPQGVPRRPGGPRVDRRGAARVPVGGGAGPQELHHLRRRRRREDDAAAGAAQRGRPRASGSSPSRTTSSSAWTATPTCTPTWWRWRPGRRTSRARARSTWPLSCAGACA